MLKSKLYLKDIKSATGLLILFFLIVLCVLVFDYFSSSFNLIFLASKSPEVAIYGSPSVENGISFK